MANIAFGNAEKYGYTLAYWETRMLQEEALERVVAKGGAVAADAIRQEIDSLPEEAFRHLGEGESFRGVPKAEKRDLQDHFGLTKIKRDKDGFLHTKAGFHGYGWRKTKKYPKGMPIPWLARTINSGTSFRAKNPFVTRAVRKAMKPAIAAMQAALDEELADIFNFNNRR